MTASEFNSTRAAVHSILNWFRKPNVWHNLVEPNSIKALEALVTSEDRDESLLLMTGMKNDVGGDREAHGCISHLMVPMGSSCGIQFFIRVESALFQTNNLEILHNYQDLDEFQYCAYDIESGEEVWTCLTSETGLVRLGYKACGVFMIFEFVRSQLVQAFHAGDVETIYSSLRHTFFSFTWSMNSSTKLLRTPYEPRLGLFDYEGVFSRFRNQSLLHELPVQGTKILELGACMGILNSLRRWALRRTVNTLTLHPQYSLEIDFDISGINCSSLSPQLLSLDDQDEDVLTT